MDPYGPPRKRPRPESGPLNGSNGTNSGHGGGDDYNKDGSSGNRTKPCTKFFSTSGCPYGEGCHFLHFVPGGVQSMGGLAPLANISSMGGGGARKVVGGVGLDDQGANLGGFKTRLCNRFDTPEGCRFSDKCHFAHGEKELRKSSNNFNTPSVERDSYARQDYSRDQGPSSASYRGGSGSGMYGTNGGRFGSGGPGGRDREASRFGSYREPTPPGMAAANSFGASSTAKISIEASLAGAIIGKGGINAKQICRLTGAKLSIKEHETDAGLRNVEMEGSFEQIKQASQMVRHVLIHRDSVPARPPAGAVSHNFKTKLCENFSKGTCTFGERCHFAHGAEDLRDPYRS
ncbi:zinc finger CCCH domain-containing protein 31 [Physcomitrium patens]|nr:zinc finger CCCH domain-containing protein 14-like [Physcomitrium patens]XP_024386826.1 zinc finger CCCH domain-containing protein 14-like [Physcomitrium patens]XP_024386832.1 zinc finger CCCH domain-containing protein 14-like [Physcomitrium patens]XP_024386840.1 zinc finger CCCH domain-containing protein 14-like [Physcomitrium patens]PNR62565.1 hypothetical protein PHYPA_000989 [Physcomitrium patens]|eukprot:XP_024386818.1 zinc finger CCCH domain-containing protein 14-like [Physcomitrella patens]